MSVVLPDHLDPWRAVRSGLTFTGAISSSEFPRLAAVVLPESSGEPAQVYYKLALGRDPDGQALVSGWVRSELRLPCQRCLGVVRIAVDAPLSLGLLKTEAAAASLPVELDPLVVEDDRIRPRDIIEDELLLAIPAFPRHEPGQCQTPPQHPAAQPVVSDDETPERPNPFAVLADLKDKTRRP